MPDERIRDAAALILTRQGAAGAEVLMGQRGAAAAFMPSKTVFPGGAVDAGDAGVALADPLDAECARRLASEAGPAPAALAAAAIRELWEEAGLALARAAAWPDPPEGWAGFAGRGLRPAAAPLRFVFRAVTPPGRTRRFDARFFLADVSAIVGPADDFSSATDELSLLRWIPLAEARRYDLPFITEIVLAEIAPLIGRTGPLPPVPFFDNTTGTPTFRRIG
jgi:8-oxo-dGTP pyrophosphatase MutT (NUDIX family)